MQSDQRFTPQVVEVLKGSGWFEGRNTEGSLRLPDGFEMFPAAGRVLVEFGGLKGGQVRAGITMAASDFDLRPELAQGESDRFQEFEKQLGVRLYPLGEAHRGHYFLAIDENGRVYLAMDDIIVLGENFETGVENLILGTLDVGTFTATSTRDLRLIKEVQDALDKVPLERRSPSHGKCMEPQWISQSLKEGINPRGGVFDVRKVRSPANPGHGDRLLPCSTCEYLNEVFGTRSLR